MIGLKIAFTNASLQRLCALRHELAEQAPFSFPADDSYWKGALGRSEKQHEYGTITDPLDLAAFRGAAVAEAHALTDGNKRAAFMTCVLFTEMNGFEIRGKWTEAMPILTDIAAKQADWQVLAAWLRERALRSA